MAENPNKISQIQVGNITYDIRDANAERTIEDLETIRSNASKSLRYFSTATSDAWTFTPTASQVSGNGTRVLLNHMIIRPSVSGYILFFTFHAAASHTLSNGEMLMAMDIGKSKPTATNATEVGQYDWEPSFRQRIYCSTNDTISCSSIAIISVTDDSRWYAYAGGITLTLRNPVEYKYRATLIGMKKPFGTQENSNASCWRDVC